MPVFGRWRGWGRACPPHLPPPHTHTPRPRKDRDGVIWARAKAETPDPLLPQARTPGPPAGEGGSFPRAASGRGWRRPGPVPTQALSAPSAPRQGPWMSPPGGPLSQVGPCPEPGPCRSACLPAVAAWGAQIRLQGYSGRPSSGFWRSGRKVGRGRNFQFGLGSAPL